MFSVLVIRLRSLRMLWFFFFNDTATTEIYTLSLHDALPISPPMLRLRFSRQNPSREALGVRRDRKSTRLNSSHVRISYAVFCLKKNKLMTINVSVPLASRAVRMARKKAIDK